MGVGADPTVLARYGAVGAELDGLLARVASDAAVISTGVGRGDRAIAEAVAGLDRLARLEAGTTRWVGAVGLAFAAADRGAGAVGAGTIDLLVHVAATPTDVGQAASAVRGVRGSGAAPELVAAVAAALGPEGIDRLVAAHPEEVGPVDGMPPTARYAANRILLQRAWASATGRRRDRLAKLLAPDPATGQPRRFLLFDGRGDGRVAEVFGDLTAAGSLAVLVPGVGTDLDDFDRTVARPARDLFTRSAALDRRDGVVVIAWLGYDPPDGLRADPGALWDLVSDDAARRGGRSLAHLLRGLGDGPPQRRTTLIGHSYGSTTVAAALQAGAWPDDVVVLGSPGVLVDRAADFHRPGTGFFTLGAPEDPVARLGWFGADPNRRGSGFRRLATGPGGHSSYLVAGSVAQANLVAVVLGRHDLLHEA